MIKKKLEYIYPYIKDRGGIDEHGNFLEQWHSRVAISPYVKYKGTSQFLTHASQVLDPTLLASKSKLAYLDLVYEYKMDFHEFLTDTKTNEEEQKAKKEAEKKATEGSLNLKPSEN